MRRIELVTNGGDPRMGSSQRVHLAWVEIAPFVSARMPDVVVWGNRCFQREVRPDSDQRDAFDAWWYVECFAVMSLTPSPGLPVCKHGKVADTCGDCEAENPTPLRAAPPPVDRTAVQLTDGSPVTADHREIRPDGQQKGYVVLSDEERAKGFVRPVRSTYVHEKCGGITTMGRSLAETYARDPAFYSGTFCATCRSHFPVGAEGEFVWSGTDIKVGT